MRIKKKEQSVGLLGKITNLFSNSKQDAYSCDYINKLTQHDLVTNGEPIKCGYKIDGKDVYVKLVDCGYLNAGVSKVAHNISNIDKMYDYDGFLRNENNGTIFAIPNISLNTLNAEVHVDIDKTNINIEAGTAFNGTLFKAYIYVYFTYNE